MPKKIFKFLLIIYLYNRQQLKYIPFNIYEKNLSAQQFSQKKKTRIQSKNGHKNRQTTYRSQTCQGKKDYIHLKINPRHFFSKYSCRLFNFIFSQCLIHYVYNASLFNPCSLITVNFQPNVVGSFTINKLFFTREKQIP